MNDDASAIPAGVPLIPADNARNYWAVQPMQKFLGQLSTTNDEYCELFQDDLSLSLCLQGKRGRCTTSTRMAILPVKVQKSGLVGMDFVDEMDVMDGVDDGR
jgi:hypothetical protein